MHRYDRNHSIVFLKTKEAFGGLSNMASGFPLKVNGIRIFTAEALYQACRFPHLPEVQRLILGQASPMTAKMKSKPHRRDSRPDWNHVRVSIMRWCLNVKLALNWEAFSKILLATDDRPIVEQSPKDDFWGAKPVDEHNLFGMNVLGLLLVELREGIKTEGRELFFRVEPLEIPNFLLVGRPIETVFAHKDKTAPTIAKPLEHPPHIITRQTPLSQTSLFDLAMVKEAESPAHLSKSTLNTDIAGLKPYPAMRDSGVPWLGKVPKHWEVLPNRAIFTEVKERDHPEEQMLSVTITKGVIRQQTLLEGSSKKDSSNMDKSAYKLVRAGDIAYNKMRAWQGAIGVSDHKGIISPAYVVQRPGKGTDSRYLHYLLRTPAFAKEAERWSYGITSDMWSLRPEHFKMIYTCLPPTAEQAAIVRFLDHYDRKIRRYIRAKQKLIKLLEEEKQAIIHRAVTRGLDPNVPLKPSGVEWLGDIPEHWEVCRAKYLFREVDDRSTTGSEVLLSLRMYQGLVPHNEVSKIPIKAEGLIGFKKVKPGQIVMNRMRAAIGMFGISNQSGLVSPDYAVFEPIANVEPAYFLQLFKSPVARKVFRIESKGLGTGSSGFMRLYSDRFGIIKLPVPAKEEQTHIIQGLIGNTREIDYTEKHVKLEISLLQEYRTRLIADVVTGKLDVREAAAKLPEEPEEPELVEEIAEQVEGEEETEEADLAMASEEIILAD